MHQAAEAVVSEEPEPQPEPYAAPEDAVAQQTQVTRGT